MLDEMEVRYQADQRSYNSKSAKICNANDWWDGRWKMPLLRELVRCSDGHQARLSNGRAMAMVDEWTVNE